MNIYKLKVIIPRFRLRLAELIGGKWHRDILNMSKYFSHELIELRQAMDERDKEYDELFDNWNTEREALLKRISELEGGDADAVRPATSSDSG